MYSRCDKCVTDKAQCVRCPENPKYANISRFSLFQAYIPTCPRGYTDCVNDPAYIKYYHSGWYKEIYGDKTPEEAAERCRKLVEEDPDMDYYCYDDEDK